MRTRLLISLLLLTLLPLHSLAGAAQTDAARFKAEYEILNGQSNFDGSAVYASLDIAPDNPMAYADETGLMAFLAGGTGILYLGFAECPWCRTLVPALLEAARDSAYPGQILYYDALHDRDQLERDEDGNLQVTEPGTDLYRHLVDVLYDYLNPYAGLDDETIKRIYFPTTVFVANGEILSVHLVTVESQTDPYAPLDDAQHAELLALLTAQIQAVRDAE